MYNYKDDNELLDFVLNYIAQVHAQSPQTEITIEYLRRCCNLSSQKLSYLMRIAELRGLVNANYKNSKYDYYKVYEIPAPKTENYFAHFERMMELIAMTKAPRFGWTEQSLYNKLNLPRKLVRDMLKYALNEHMIKEVIDTTPLGNQYIKYILYPKRIIL